MSGRRKSTDFVFPWDQSLFDSMESENSKKMEEFQKEEEEAVTSAGDTDVQAVKGRRAEYQAMIGDKVFMQAPLHFDHHAKYARTPQYPPTKPSSKTPAPSAPKSTSSSP